MDPVLEKIVEVGDICEFTLSNINVSLANAIRRTILSDIPVTCFYTEKNKDNDCNIEINTSRFHNEIIKHRLSCIPIHEKDATLLPGKYILELDVKNDSDNMIVITTEQFKIKNKTNGNYLTKDETKRIFPPNHISQCYIDFVRLRPKISETIPGEEIKLTSEFSVNNAKTNSVYNVVSICSYSNTQDRDVSNKIWEEYENKLRSKDTPIKDIQFQKRNFELLDSQRYYKEDSFDFILQTIGIFTNKEIIKKSCSIIYDKFVQFNLDLESDTIPIINSEVTMENCYDIVILNEDYTMGNILQYLMYEKYYNNEKVLSFCGFKKIHPHNLDSVLRVAYLNTVDKTIVLQNLKVIVNDAIAIFKKLYSIF